MFVSHSYLLAENLKQFLNYKRNPIGEEFFFKNFKPLLFSIKIKSSLSSQNHTTIFTHLLVSLASLASLSQPSEMHTFTYKNASEKALRSVLQVLLFLPTADAGIQGGTTSISSASLNNRKPCIVLSLSLQQSLLHPLSSNLNPKFQSRRVLNG